MRRITWEELPVPARAAVRGHTGTIHVAADAGDGVNSAVAARLTTSVGDVFVKGVPIDHPQVATQQREADINPYLPASCPRLLWRERVAGWDILVFELLHGRRADFTVGSPDLPQIVDTLAELAATPCPQLPLKQAGERWAEYLGPAERGLLGGGNLLHTDVTPDNVVIDSATGTAHLVDWAWPTRGPAWIDPAIWVIRLVDAGHTPEDAETWAARLPAWRSADPRAVIAFARANVRLWDEIAGNDPVRWKTSMAASVRRWANHRVAS